jgi:hypothetical protein
MIMMVGGFDKGFSESLRGHTKANIWFANDDRFLGSLEGRLKGQS